MAGYPPFRASTVEEIIQLIQKAPVVLSEALSSTSKSFLQLLLDKDENKRLENVSKLKSQKFFKNIDWERIRNKKTQSPLNAIESSK